MREADIRGCTAGAYVLAYDLSSVWPGGEKIIHYRGSQSALWLCCLSFVFLCHTIRSQVIRSVIRYTQITQSHITHHIKIKMRIFLVNWELCGAIIMTQRYKTSRWHLHNFVSTIIWQQKLNRSEKSTSTEAWASSKSIGLELISTAQNSTPQNSFS